MTFKIINDKKKCIQCGACLAVCDDWEFDSDGLAQLKNVKYNDDKIGEKRVEDVGCNQQAKDVCPTDCIEINEE